MAKYLILGASSELALDFIKKHSWQPDDEIVAQYCRNKTSLEELPHNITLLQGDFSSAESTDNFVAGLKDMKFVPTHILHAPAIGIETKRFTEISWDEVQKQLDVQCQSAFKVLQAVIKPMAKKKQGKIVMVLSSCTQNVPPKFLSGYVMAKYALLGLGKALAAEYSAKNIQVNMVSPSMMETKFLSGLHESVAQTSAQNNPLKRNASTSDVAGIIEYLFSEANTFVTGANIPVTGGEIF